MSATVPLVSSSTKGPLGAVHLPRLWLKLSLAAHGQLPKDYDECGAGFDQMTLNALGLDRQQTIDYVRSNHPSYMDFERWVVEQNGGNIDRARIETHNAAVHGYNHSDEVGTQMRQSSGIKHEHVKDAVTLNTMEDLDAFHRQMHPNE
ncbi:MAG: DUF5069 domain-containing protein [Candidatus Eremiobacteraeota bacterium]|nr:DUF5069 domain-containing protein [Candidatus Eremiobacteraeota bacterium]